MKKGRFISVVVLALCLVVGIGILYSTLYAGCYCYGACWACIEDECQTYDGSGGCFCNTSTCTPSEHRICCETI
jgi:hypothetical protein